MGERDASAALQASKAATWSDTAAVSSSRTARPSLSDQARGAARRPPARSRPARARRRRPGSRRSSYHSIAGRPGARRRAARARRAEISEHGPGPPAWSRERDAAARLVQLAVAREQLPPGGRAELSSGAPRMGRKPHGARQQGRAKRNTTPPARRRTPPAPRAQLGARRACRALVALGLAAQSCAGLMCSKAGRDGWSASAKRERTGPSRCCG